MLLSLAVRLTLYCLSVHFTTVMRLCQLIEKTKLKTGNDDIGHKPSATTISADIDLWPISTLPWPISSSMWPIWLWPISFVADIDVIH